MDAREQRGLVIAATQNLKQKGKVWIVPSQTGSGKYTVLPDADAPHCTCPDHDNGFVCKHIYAVRYAMVRTTVEQNVDGSTTTTTETVTVTQTVEKRKTYAQDWPNYNRAQNNEKRHFQDLLASLAATVPQPAPKGGKKGGRPPVPTADALFAIIFKVYSGMSARRFMCDLQDAHERGHIRAPICHNSVLKAMESAELTPILKGLVEASALPLSRVETKFAVDSTGFATTKYTSWYDAKYNDVRSKQTWVKAHLMTGVFTNVVSAVNIDHQDAADSPQLPELVETTKNGFHIDEVSADKAYACESNFSAVEQFSADFYPMFKANTTGGIGGSFQRAFHYFSLHQQEYLDKYHLRSNVESTVSMVKRKFGDMVRSKTDVAMKNEVYAKFVAHNLCCLVSAIYELGVGPVFWKDGQSTMDRTPNLTRMPLNSASCPQTYGQGEGL
jgi:transposase